MSAISLLCLGTLFPLDKFPRLFYLKIKPNNALLWPRRAALQSSRERQGPRNKTISFSRFEHFNCVAVPYIPWMSLQSSRGSHWEVVKLEWTTRILAIPSWQDWLSATVRGDDGDARVGCEAHVWLILIFLPLFLWIHRCIMIEPPCIFNLACNSWNK